MIGNPLARVSTRFDAKPGLQEIGFVLSFRNSLISPFRPDPIDRVRV